MTLLKPGDEVLGMPLFPHFPGGYSEYVAAPSRQFVRKPAVLTHVQAAALPLASLTAYQALHDFAEVQPGQKVLVHAAAGGVGHVAVQIAKALGAHVTGTASAAKHEFVRGLGADEVIDYHEVDFAEVLSGFDAVIDAIGGDYFDRSLRVLKPGGTLVALNYDVTTEMRARAAEAGVTAAYMLVEPDYASLSAIRGLVTEGRLRPVIDSGAPAGRGRQGARTRRDQPRHREDRPDGRGRLIPLTPSSQHLGSGHGPEVPPCPLRQEATPVIKD